MHRLLPIAISLAILVPAARGAERLTPEQEARARIVESIVAMARARLAQDRQDELGLRTFDVAEAIYPWHGAVSKLRRELANDRIKTAEAMTAKAFATELARYATSIRTERRDGSTLTAILLARLALEYDPELADARLLIPDEDRRADFDSLVEQVRRVRRVTPEVAAERAAGYAVIERLRGIQVESFALRQGAGAEDLNRLIRLAVDLGVPLRVEFRRTPLTRADSYGGATLYRAPMVETRGDRTFTKVSFLHVLSRTVIRLGLYWHIDGQSVVVTDLSTGDPAERGEGATARQVPVRSAVRLHREFASSALNAMQQYRGKTVRVELHTAKYSAIVWNFKRLRLEGMEIDLGQGAAADLGRVTDLLAAIKGYEDGNLRGKHLRVVVTGRIHNYMSKTIYVDQVDLLEWSWAANARR